MRSARWGIVCVCAVLLMSQPAWAARTPMHEAAESQVYGRKAGGMLGRGLLNVATSFVDIIVHIVNDTKAGPPLVGTLTGIAKGTGCGVLRLGSGAVDLITFWVPGFNGFPVSDSYDDCLAVSGATAAAPMPMETQTVFREEVPVAEPGAAQLPPAVSPAPQPPAHNTWKK